TFAFLPNKVIQQGDRWTRQRKLSMGPLGTYVTRYEYIYEGVEGALDKISVTGTMTYEEPSADVAGGLAFQIKGGDLKSRGMTGTILCNRDKGQLEHSTLYLKLEGKLKIDIGAEATTAELSQTQKTTVKTTDVDPTAKK